MVTVYWLMGADGQVQWTAATHRGGGHWESSPVSQAGWGRQKPLHDVECRSVTLRTVDSREQI